MKCWLCSVEPDDITEVVTFGGEVVRRVPAWPSGDHQHAVVPPSPPRLEQAGHEALMRIVGEGHQ